MDLCSFTQMAQITNESYLYKSYTNTQSSNILDVVDPGLYEVIEQYNDYYEIKVYDNVHKILFFGWMNGASIRSNVIIKRSPLLDVDLSTVIVNINKGSRIINIKDKNCGWIKIKSKNNKTGWIPKSKFKFVGGDLW